MHGVLSETMVNISAVRWRFTCYVSTKSLRFKNEISDAK